MTTTHLTMPATVAAELEATLDGRTREILQRRRASKVVHRRGWLIRRALAGADMLGLTIAFFLAVWLFGGDAPGPVADRLGRQFEVLLFLLTLPGWVVMAKLYGLYERDEERTDHSTADDFGGVFHMITLGAWGTFLLGWGTDIVAPEIDKIIGFWALAILFVCVLRATARAYCRRQVEYLQNTIIVGAGDVGQLIAKKYLNHPEYGINLVGFVDSEPKERREDLGHLTLLSGPERLCELVELFDVERVVIAFSNERHEEELDLIRQLKAYDVQVDVVPRLYEVVGPGVGMHTVEGVPLLGLAPPCLSSSSRVLKRTMDLVLTIPGLILLLPLLLAIAVAIKLDTRGPVFFRQVRMGADGIFRIWKFRTMWLDADERKHEFAHLNDHLAPGGDPRMFKIEADPRVTRVGGLLRRLSLDELPQLLNVIVGQMSLVGPRPLILEEDCHVEDWARGRLALKPGITGIWQAAGRSNIPFSEMTNLDYIYVTNWSFMRDFSLLLRTFPAVIRSRGAA
jgi:exopolysaccharide biosynthesis polyprenyl glycosylphosphotransferase